MSSLRSRAGNLTMDARNGRGSAGKTWSPNSIVADAPSKHLTLLFPRERDLHPAQLLQIERGGLAAGKNIPLQIGRQEREAQQFSIVW